MSAKIPPSSLGRNKVVGGALTCHRHGHDVVAEQALHLVAGVEEQIIAQQWFGTLWQENKGILSHLLYLRKSAEV